MCVVVTLAAEATGRIAGLEVDVQTQQGMVRGLKRSKDDAAAQLRAAHEESKQLRERQESFRRMYDDGSAEVGAVSFVIGRSTTGAVHLWVGLLQMVKKRPKKLAVAMAQIEYYENELQNADASMEAMKAALEETSRVMMKDIQVSCSTIR